MSRFVLMLFLINYSVLHSCVNASLEHSQLEKRGVIYLTYTRDNCDDSSDIRNINFDDNCTNMFIIQGHLSTSLEKPLKLKDDLFKYDQNVGRVIVVSWMDYSVLFGKKTTFDSLLSIRYFY